VYLRLACGRFTGCSPRETAIHDPLDERCSSATTFSESMFWLQDSRALPTIQPSDPRLISGLSAETWHSASPAGGKALAVGTVSAAVATAMTAGIMNARITGNFTRLIQNPWNSDGIIADSLSYCTVYHESPCSAGVEDRVLIGAVMSAPTKLD
jgi:hypothetical protein